MGAGSSGSPSSRIGLAGIARCLHIRGVLAHILPQLVVHARISVERKEVREGELAIFVVVVRLENVAHSLGVGIGV